jgi:outer membrane protein assembly factor BamE
MPAALRAFLAAAALALGACGVPQIVTPYRMEIQQGNYVSQEMVSQLKPGMSREQVRFILGTPLVTDIFHADRWDYVFYRELPYGKREQRLLSVHFEGGKLVRVAGDVVPAAPGAAAPPAPSTPQKPAAETAATPPAPQKPAAEAAAGTAAEKPEAAAAAATAKPEAPAAETKADKPAAQSSERGFFGRMLEKIGF